MDNCHTIFIYLKMKIRLLALYFVKLPIKLLSNMCIKITIVQWE